MSISFSCEHCGKQMRAEVKDAGRQAKCKACKNPVKIPLISLQTPINQQGRPSTNSEDRGSPTATPPEKTPAPFPSQVVLLAGGALLLLAVLGLVGTTIFFLSRPGISELPRNQPDTRQAKNADDPPTGVEKTKLDGEKKGRDSDKNSEIPKPAKEKGEPLPLTKQKSDPESSPEALKPRPGKEKTDPEKTNHDSDPEVRLRRKKNTPDGEKAGSEGTPKESNEKSTINKAITQGVEYLKSRVRDEGSFYSFQGSNGGAHVGAAALTGLTLLECGVPATDPTVRSLATVVRGASSQLTFTYSIALSILFLDRLCDARAKDTNDADRLRIQSLALRLIAAQNKKGGWHYHCPILNTFQERALGNFLMAKQFIPGHLDVFRPGQDDHSIGQFATLALWCARRHQVIVAPTLATAAARYREKQNPNGSWGYRDSSPFFHDSSTCAGLIAIAIGLGIDGHGKKVESKKALALLQDPAVARALAYLAKIMGKKAGLPADVVLTRRKHTADMEHFFRLLERKKDQVTWNQFSEIDRWELELGTIFGADAWGDLYFLWSLERMAVMYNLNEIDGKDWYRWGAKMIVANQKQDGSWQDRFPGIPDTCFALLFLRRMNLAPDLTEIILGVRLEETKSKSSKHEEK